MVKRETRKPGKESQTGLFVVFWLPLKFDLPEG
jgi:hypothetical protein